MHKGSQKRETHILEWGLGLTKKIIAHYGSRPGPTGDGQPGREEGSGEEGRENKRVKPVRTAGGSILGLLLIVLEVGTGAGWEGASYSFWKVYR